MKRYKTIYADPPWNETGGGKIRRGADRHYPLMCTQEILDLASIVKAISEENCHLYLWVTNNFLPDGLKVMDRWGFRYVTKITWQKDRIGLGQYFRGNTEDCLFGVKGVLPYKVVDGTRQQGVTGFCAPRKKHSEKPEKMRQMIEIVSYGPYLEMFARKEISGWDVWGNEVESSVILSESKPHSTDAQDGKGSEDVTPAPNESPPPNAESDKIFSSNERVCFKCGAIARKVGTIWLCARCRSYSRT